MTTDCFNFLVALTFSAGEESPILDASPGNFHPDLVSAVESFCQGFRDYAGSLGLNPDDIEHSRDFGANVFFSLSGHGVGFLDDSGPWGDIFQGALENYAGGRHRFETLAENCDWTGTRQGEGEIDLAFIPSAMAEYREKFFGIPVPESVPPLSLTIAENQEKEEFRIHPGPAKTFRCPPYWEGDLLRLYGFTADKFREVLETNG